MSEIQRWRMLYEGAWAEMLPRADGEYVTYADHVAALAQAEQRGRDGVAAIATEALRQWYEQGQRDALAGAVQRVESHLATYQRRFVAGIIAAIRGDA